MSQSKLRFSIEESVWLKKGQEVAEVLSMSLNPEISITEEAGQVYIKGALILNGKYCPEKKSEDEGATLNENPLIEGVSYRSLTQLNVSEDGMTELVHRFPVDITIPSYRVEDSSQVKVEVESFEYELPNSTCFELSASICIYGIKDEKQRQEEQSYEAQKEAVRSATPEERTAQQEEKSDIFTPFQFEARQSGGVPSQPQHNEFLARLNEDASEVRNEKKTSFEFKPYFEPAEDKSMEATFDSLKSIAFSNDDMRNLNNDYELDAENHEDDEEPTEQPEYQTEQEENEQQYESYEDHQVEGYQSQGAYHHQETEHQNQQTYQEQNRPYEYNPYQQQQEYQQQQYQEQQQEYQQQPYQQQETNYPGYQPNHYYSERPSSDYGEQTYQDDQEYTDESYLHSEEEQKQYHQYEEETSYEEAQAPHAEREEEPKDENALYLTKMLSGNEDRFSKMKMYILQRGDSLEYICERYDISLNTLMRMNQLQQGEVSEGQIIYIPVSSR